MKVYRSNIAQRITTGDRKTPEGILPFDFDNKYPDRCINTVNSSGTGTKCVDLYARFIEGMGFANPEFYKAKINAKGLTNDKLLRHLSKNYAMHGGFAIHVNYNANYQITDVNYIPFKDCRLVHPESEENRGKIAVYYDWARYVRSTIRKTDIHYIDTFNPDPLVIQAQVDSVDGWENYKGQIIWFSTAGQNYPLAPYDAVMEDMETEGRIKNHKRKKAASGFNADYLLALKSKFENDQERLDFIKNLEYQQGDEAAGNITLIEAEAEEMLPTLIKIDKADAKGDFYLVNENSVQDNIRKSFGFTKPQVGGEIAGLGISQAILESTSYMNGMTNRERREMEEIFKAIFERFETKLNSTGDYSITPITIIQEKVTTQPALAQ